MQEAEKIICNFVLGKVKFHLIFKCSFLNLNKCNGNARKCIHNKKMLEENVDYTVFASDEIHPYEYGFKMHQN